MAQFEPRILCVADDSAVAESMQRALAPEFGAPRAVSSAGMPALLAEESPCAIVVVDQQSTGTGVETLRQFKTRWPEMTGVLATHSSELEPIVVALHEGAIYRLVRSPWAPEDLALAVRDAVAYQRLIRNERELREQLARTNAELDEKVEDLDEANELLEYWVEFSPAVLYSLSCDHGVLHPSYISKNFSRLTGFERTAAVIDADFWARLVETADRARYRETLAALVASDHSHAVLEYRIRHRDGNEVVVLDSMRAVRDGDGHTIEIVGAWMDVSARR